LICTAFNFRCLLNMTNENAARTAVLYTSVNVLGKALSVAFPSSLVGRVALHFSPFSDPFSAFTFRVLGLVDVTRSSKFNNYGLCLCCHSPYCVTKLLMNHLPVSCSCSPTTRPAPCCPTRRASPCLCPPPPPPPMPLAIKRSAAGCLHAHFDQMIEIFTSLLLCKISLSF
jgi:hypothetical protein